MKFTFINHNKKSSSLNDYNKIPLSKINKLYSSKGFSINKKSIEKNQKYIDYSLKQYNIYSKSYNNNPYINYMKIEKNNINLNYIQTLSGHKNIITSMSIFASGNFISVSRDKSIIIYDKNFNELQKIENAHEYNIINGVDVKDESNFITNSLYEIRIWIKNNNNFILNQIISYPHQEIKDVKYCLNGNLISLGFEKILKLWNFNNIYQNIMIIKCNIICFCLLNENKILITLCNDGLRFWNIYNYECLSYFKDLYKFNDYKLNKIDDDKIIIQGEFNEKSIKIFSISNMKTIKILNYEYLNFVGSIQDKGIFMLGNQKYFYIYNINDYQFIKKIKHYHNEKYSVNGIIKLKNEFIASYSNDNKINIWSLN